ncbi:MAG: hypothetical protein NC311_00625 [Muribaculaceae bacterium]|nr:hypothetical protein [Muribaculaceae bacterium]
MNTLAIAAILATVSVGAYAADGQMPDTEKTHKNFMELLTEDQRSCIEKYGCKMPEPGQRPEKNADAKRPTQPDDSQNHGPKDMDCIRQAMESCGVQMPTPPARPTDGANVKQN